MAGTAKSIYLTVCPKGSHKSVFKRTFFNAKDYNEYVKSDDFKVKYPKEEFEIIREVY
jgi:hypothetical protein